MKANETYESNPGETWDEREERLKKEKGGQDEPETDPEEEEDDDEPDPDEDEDEDD